MTKANDTPIAGSPHPSLPHLLQHRLMEPGNPPTRLFDTCLGQSDGVSRLATAGCLVPAAQLSAAPAPLSRAASPRTLWVPPGPQKWSC